jgi:hypothetical protein
LFLRIFVFAWDGGWRILYFIIELAQYIQEIEASLHHSFHQRLARLALATLGTLEETEIARNARYWTG